MENDKTNGFKVSVTPNRDAYILSHYIDDEEVFTACIRDWSFVKLFVREFGKEGLLTISFIKGTN